MVKVYVTTAGLDLIGEEQENGIIDNLFQIVTHVKDNDPATMRMNFVPYCKYRKVQVGVKLNMNLILSSYEPDDKMVEMHKDAVVKMTAQKAGLSVPSKKIITS